MRHKGTEERLTGEPAERVLAERLLCVGVEGVWVLGERGESDDLPLLGVALMLRGEEAADEVVLVPARADDDDQGRRVEARARVGQPPVPGEVARGRGVRLGEVLDQVVQDHDLRAPASDRLTDRAREQTAALRCLPFLRGSGVRGDREADARTLLLDVTADLTAPAGREGGVVGEQHDRPVGVAGKQPQREVNGCGVRLAGPWREGDNQEA